MSMISIKKIKIIRKNDIQNIEKTNEKILKILNAEKANLDGFPNPKLRNDYYIFNRSNIANNSEKYFIFFNYNGDLKYINFFSFKRLTKQELSEIVFIFKIRMYTSAFLLTNSDFESLKKNFKISTSDDHIIDKLVYTNVPLFLIDKNSKDQIEKEFKKALGDYDGITHAAIKLTYLELENSFDIQESFYSKFEINLTGPKYTFQKDFDMTYQDIISFIKKERVDDYIVYPLYLIESIRNFFCYHPGTKLIIKQIKAELESEYATSFKKGISEDYMDTFNRIISKKINFMFELLADNKVPYNEINNIAMFMLNDLFHSSKIIFNDNPMMLFCCSSFIESIKKAMMNADHVEYYKIAFDSKFFEIIKFLDDIKLKYDWKNLDRI